MDILEGEKAPKPDTQADNHLDSIWLTIWWGLIRLYSVHAQVYRVK